MTCYGSIHDAACRAASGPVSVYRPALMPMVEHAAPSRNARARAARAARWVSDVKPRAALAAFDAEAAMVAADHAALRAIARGARIDARRRFS